MKRIVTISGILCVNLLLLGFSLLMPGAALAQSPVVNENTVDSDALCWKKQECQDQLQEEGKTFSTDAWVAKPDICKSEDLGYCYNPTVSYDLIIDLGAVSNVRGIAGYTQALFSLAIVVGTIGIILTTMVAGFKWMTAAGNSGAVDDARDLIEKAITSLVILLLVITGANLIDPKLSVLPDLRTPKIKKLTFISEDSSCDYLKSLNFKISPDKAPNTKSCGSKGKVVELPPDSGRKPVIGAEIGKECVYTGCGDPNGSQGSCIQDPSAKENGGYRCVACADYSAVTGQPASARACASFARGVVTKDGESYDCHYFPPEGWMQELDEFTTIKNHGVCAEIVYPANNSRPVVDMARLKLKSAAPNGCDEYNKITLSQTSSWFFSGNGYNTLQGMASVSEEARSLLRTYCESDSRCALQEARSITGTLAAGAGGVLAGGTGFFFSGPLGGGAAALGGYSFGSWLAGGSTYFICVNK